MNNHSITEHIRLTVETQLNNYFESRNLLNPLKKSTVLLAVSGGADSMVMLDVMYSLSDKLNFSIIVITVNHNIREVNESLADALLVESECKKYKNVQCIIHTINPGVVNEIAQKRGKGIEEAARFLRYQAFNEECKNNRADVICLAHNKNDRLETILQRFFQGATDFSASGMQISRDNIFRPLFFVSRDEIEHYALCNNIQYATDSTNKDNTYYRNRIRNVLVPVLNEIVPGWATGLIHGAEKNIETSKVIENLANISKWEKIENGIAYSIEVFDKAMYAVQMKILYNGISLFAVNKRITYGLLEEFLQKKQKVQCADFIIERQNDNIVIRNVITSEKEITGFYMFITEEGFYQLPFGNFLVKKSTVGVEKNWYYAENLEMNCVSGNFTLPVVIRSRKSSDKIQCANDGTKEISKILSEWKVPTIKKNLIPIFEDSCIRGIWGNCLGFPNWFVK